MKDDMTKLVQEKREYETAVCEPQVRGCVHKKQIQIFTRHKWKRPMGRSTETDCARSDYSVELSEEAAELRPLGHSIHRAFCAIYRDLGKLRPKTSQPNKLKRKESRKPDGTHQELPLMKTSATNTRYREMLIR